jgi:hypothetical protein
MSQITPLANHAQNNSARVINCPNNVGLQNGNCSQLVKCHIAVLTESDNYKTDTV